MDDGGINDYFNTKNKIDCKILLDVYFLWKKKKKMIFWWMVVD